MQKHQLAIVAVKRNQPAPQRAGMLKHHPVSRAGHIFSDSENIETSYPQSLESRCWKVLVDQQKRRHAAALWRAMYCSSCIISAAKASAARMSSRVMFG